MHYVVTIAPFGASERLPTAMLCVVAESETQAVNRARIAVPDHYAEQGLIAPTAYQTVVEGFAEPIRVVYTNYKHKTAVRHIVPLGVRWGTTEWHKTPGILLRVYDVDQKAEREYELAKCNFIGADSFAALQEMARNLNGLDLLYKPDVDLASSNVT